MTQLAMPIVTAWEQVREIRERVAEVLRDAPAELRDAAAMAASELVENAIKHGDHAPGAPPAQFELTTSADELVIAVANVIRSPSEVQSLRERIEHIANHADKEALYLDRLREHMNDPGTSGRLGLYRIAYEGKFELELSCAGQLVTIFARRRRV